MKTKLNILCVLVISLIIASFVSGYFYFQVGLNEADRDAGVYKDAEVQPVTDVITVSMLPQPDKNIALKMTNEVTGKEMNVWPVELIVEKEDAQPASFTYNLVNGIITFLCLIAMVVAVFTFIGFIMRVNKGSIFDSTNITYLRVCGFCLLFFGITDILVGCYESWYDGQLFQLANFKNSPLPNLNITCPMLGLISLVVGQVFAMAKKMQEEQELTI